MVKLSPVVFALLFLTTTACQTTPTVEQQSAALTLSKASLSDRQIQSRRFDSGDERFILAACAGVLQDLGFTLDESSSQTGLLVASKDRDAVEAGQVTGQIILTLMAAALGAQHNPVWEKNQKIRISIVTKPLKGKETLVRVTFQRIIWDSSGRVSRVQTINEPKLYQEFFDKLSQSVFLEAHQI
jgi:hypothetical protein